MNALYEFVGRLVMDAIRERYRAQIRAAIAGAILVGAIGGYLALKRDVAEG